MKTGISFLLTATMLLQCNWLHSQLPMPCAHPTHTQITSLNGTQQSICTVINAEETPLTLDDENVRHFVADQQIAVQQGTTILPSGDGAFSAMMAGGALQLAWFAPMTGYEVPRYEKVEWGILLPPAVEAAIDNWITNDQTGSNLQPAINPFDPDQLDLRADIWHIDPWSNEWTTEPDLANGFFYQEFARNTTDPDHNLWDWDEITSPYRFRIRWSPVYMTEHKVKIQASVPGFGEFEAGEFSFMGTYNEMWRSFVQVSANQHYLTTADNSIFFPVGMNIQEESYDCGCDNSDTDVPEIITQCADCYDLGDQDPCCGLNHNNRLNRNKAWVAGNTVKEMCLPVASYVKLEGVVDQLSENGANAFRFVQFSSSFDIEFEKVNNYYDRQYQAWEFDKLIEQTKNLNMRMELCMNYQHQIQQHKYGCTNWDFYDTNNCDEAGMSQEWGYKGEFSLTEPIQFFSELTPQLAYKKKLRYYIARWGYSPTIFLMELFSEVNNVGSGTLYDYYLNPCDVSTNDAIPRPYTNDMNYRFAIGQWHNEMAGYIKSELKHNRHLISTDYAGNGPMHKYIVEGDACIQPLSDDTWLSPDIDVVCYNNYQLEANRFKVMATDEYTKINCISTNYSSVPKPVLYGENGVGSDPSPCDYTGYIKELVSIPFSGHASSGMSWDENEDQTHWHWMGKVRNFLENEFFDEIDLATDTWLPGHAYSNNGEESQAEAVYLRRTETNHKKLIGVIMNRTWNWYTVGEGGYCDSIPVDFGTYLPIYMQTFEDIGDSDQALKIPDMELATTYRTKYYDPITLDVIEDVYTNTVDTKLRLENYALLTENRPFVFFKSWKNDDGEQFLPQSNESNSQSEYTRSDFEWNNINESLVKTERNNAHGLILYPNPANTLIHIVFENLESGNVEIFNSLGELMYCVSAKTALDLNISNWPAGVYCVKHSEFYNNLQFIKL